MTAIMDHVGEFHRAYDCAIKQNPDISDPKLNALRVSLIYEELRELEVALREGDIVETLDALVDLEYVIAGAYLSFGLADCRRRAKDEVHRSNMTKLGADGKPVHSVLGKVVKGPYYEPPNLDGVLEMIYGGGDANG